MNTALILKPRNTVTNTGDVVVLTCSTNITEYPVAWYFIPHGLGQIASMVYRSRKIQSRFEHKFKVTPLNNDYSLRIEDAQFDDAGTYFCIDDDNFGNAERASAQLVVIGSIDHSLTLLLMV